MNGVVTPAINSHQLSVAYNPYQSQTGVNSNTFKTNSQSNSQNHDADLSLSQSFLTAQIQQS